MRKRQAAREVSIWLNLMLGQWTVGSYYTILTVKERRLHFTLPENRLFQYRLLRRGEFLFEQQPSS